MSRRGFVEFFTHAVHVAAKALDRLKLQMGSRLERACGDARGGDRGELVDFAQRGRGGKEVLRMLETLVVEAAFFGQLIRLDQQEPTFRWQVAGKMRTVGPIGLQ